MKKILMAVFAFFVTGALLAPARAQEGAAGQAEAAAAPVPAPAVETPPDPAMKKKAKKKAAKKAAEQQAAAAPAAVPVPAAEAAGAASGEPAPADAVQAPVPAPVPAPAAAAVAAPQPEAAAPAPEAKPAPVTARRSSCQACFQTLPAGYDGILAELKPWLTEMENQAADLDQRLSDIQKQIDGKDDAIEKARLITDKKESKAAVKNLGKERKALLKEYSGASDQKDDFYKQFSKEVEKRTLAHLKLLEDSLQATLSAASD
ncbi:MAG TPA: hypothetical protein DCW72_03875 [Elusimicrobia bacterium]|nr:MAG: hypothetical protein A2X29_10860 [Elusimicrobia bacterium GWA2_64_40]OGR62527.1 MAG: hypothetical protein A2X30_07770 [Elusimicrobia bacterium GWB2_63_16]HAN05932.1 hypothetical protein [Elusimicrobiota bacterium]HAU89387.1 hypothetical protein [Elusimicrobiota bacterium]